MKKNSKESENPSEIGDRIRQIRTILFDNNNREFAAKIGENEQVLSAICVGRRPAGITTIIKIVETVEQINSNWLLTGNGDMLLSCVNQQSYKHEETQQADSAVTLLREMMREKDAKISELTADNALLKNELRAALYEKEGASVEKSGQHTSTATELSTI